MPDMLELIVKIIGSKWFVLFLGVAMCFAIPTTWHNATAVSQWWTIAVFAVNILAIFFCSYKFVSMLSAGRSNIQQAQQSQW